MPRIGRTALFGLVAALVVVIALPLTVIVIRSGNSSSQAPRGSGHAPQHSPAGGMLWGMWIKDSDGQPDPSAVIVSRDGSDHLNQKAGVALCLFDHLVCRQLSWVAVHVHKESKG